MKKIISGLFALLISYSSIAQAITQDELDKCGVYMMSESQLKSELSATNWGYSYADLEADIKIWAAHEFIEVSSIGQSVEEREIYVLTIQKPTAVPEFSISIHARTHPGEEESFYVTEQMIELLMSDDETAQKLLDKCVFTIIPMYNPDGVELNFPRENANDIDIESNWGSSSPEPEVAALKAFFTEKMESELPINIALNMHSAYDCTRYFVCHHPNGTNEQFWLEQQRFVGAVQSYFTGGIKDYDYYVSWSSGTPTRYPESWFWRNYNDQVLALTYEDGNCESAGDFDKTAYALLAGISDYLLNPNSTPKHVKQLEQLTTYPNPLSGSGNMHITFPTENTVILSAKMVAITGIQYQLKLNNYGHTADVELPYLQSGIYILVIETATQKLTERIIIR